MSAFVRSLFLLAVPALLVPGAGAYLGRSPEPAVGRTAAVVAVPRGVRPGEASQPACAVADSELRRTVGAVHEKQRNVGLAAVLRQGGSTIFSDYRGLAELEHEVPVVPESRFGIASVTKLFTAVTLLQLVAENRIDLDVPVQRYVARFPEKPEGAITVEMLATHRSGIPHPGERTPGLFATHYETAMEALEVFADDSLVAVPGAERVYSSSNYNLLAAVMERVGGRPFPEVVEERILAPLGLEATSFDDIRRPTPHRSGRYSFYHPWTYAESESLYVVPRWDYSFNLGGGNLISTAEDVARFGEALVEPGLVPEEQWERLYSETWFGRPDDAGRRRILVTGANPGVQAALAIYPDSELVGVVLSNTWGLGSRSGEMVMLAVRLAELCRDG